MKPIAITERLKIRRFILSDAKFIVRLVNQPDWIKYIGERNIHTINDAVKYLKFGPLAMYENHGFGLYAVESLDKGQLIGMCGLLKRDILDTLDIGFAFLPEYYGCGYGIEAARAVANFAKINLGLTRLLAIVNPDNLRSVKLLEKIGFIYERQIEVEAKKPKVNLMMLDLGN